MNNECKGARLTSSVPDVGLQAIGLGGSRHIHDLQVTCGNSSIDPTEEVAASVAIASKTEAAGMVSTNTLSRSTQTPEINATISVLGLNATKPVCHVGPWTRIWANHVSTRAAFTLGLDTTWQGTPATAQYAGRVGSYKAVPLLAHVLEDSIACVAGLQVAMNRVSTPLWNGTQFRINGGIDRAVWIRSSAST
eukprot:1393923-Amphidinium_carterae.2